MQCLTVWLSIYAVLIIVTYLSCFEKKNTLKSQQKLIMTFQYYLPNPASLCLTPLVFIPLTFCFSIPQSWKLLEWALSQGWMGGCVRCLPDREPCWNVIPTGAGEWRGANAHVDAPQVLELEGKTPQEALLIKGGGRDGWVPTAAVLNLCLVHSYQNNSKWSNLWNVWAPQFTLILWSLNQLQKLYNYIALSFCPSFLVFLRDKSNYSGHSPSLM